MTRTAARVTDSTHGDASRRTGNQHPELTDWFFEVDATGRTGAENMAADVALLQRAETASAGFLRLYRWSPPCLSFGRNEPARARYDRAVVERLGLDTVRRPTGGRAVWHDDEVTYAVAAPVTVFGSLRDTYLAIHEMIARAIERLGVRTGLTGRGAHEDLRRSGACFASPAEGEITVGSRKLVGSAQVRQGNAFLQHGSILLGNEQDTVAAVAKGSYRTPRAISLVEALGCRIGFDEAGAAVLNEARRSWPGRWSPMGAGAWDASAGSTGGGALVAADFNDPDWTWRR